MDPDASAPSELAAEIRQFFDDAGRTVPFTSSEVADAVGCSRTTAYKYLQRLADDGVLESKKVGARARVWWRPMGPEQEAIQAESVMFEAVFEKAFDAMIIADDDATWVDVNPAACELFGLPREELIGRHQWC